MATIVGKCQDMCPRREREWREKERLLHPFEILDGTASQMRPKADQRKAVKAYSRSAAGQLHAALEDLRPPAVLLKTSRHLMQNIAASSHPSWTDIYGFIWDRLWSLRQDMTIQQASGRECVTVLEHAVRFYVYSSFRCCSEDCSHFDSYINAQHLQECLKRLLVMYRESDEACSNRPEMEAMYLLHNLGSLEALGHCLNLPAQIRNNFLVSTAIEIGTAHHVGNFVRMFRGYKKLPFLLACCLHQHLERTRRHALQVLNTAYSSQNCKFPLCDLACWMQCQEEEVNELCSFYKVTVVGKDVKFHRSSGDFGSKLRKPHQDTALREEMNRIDIADLLTGGTKALSWHQKS